MAPRLRRVRLDVRVPPGMLAWVEAYAEQRESTRTAVVEAALREFMALTSGGVPDLPQPSEAMATMPGRSVPVPARVGRPGGSRRPAAPNHLGDLGLPKVQTARELMLERQARLNRGKG